MLIDLHSNVRIETDAFLPIIKLCLNFCFAKSHAEVEVSKSYLSLMCQFLYGYAFAIGQFNRIESLSRSCCSLKLDQMAIAFFELSK